jgi:hypothetical protein
VDVDVDSGAERGSEAGRDLPDQQWIAGVRLMVTEPALQGELQKANVVAQAALAEAIAERTGAEPGDLGPQLAAAAVGAALTVAVDQWMRTDPPTPLAALLREVLHRLESGLPIP